MYMYSHIYLYLHKMRCMVKLQELATQPPCHKNLFERVTNHLCPMHHALSAWDRDERANVGSAKSSPVSPDPSCHPPVGFTRATPSLALKHLDTSLNSDWATAKDWMFALNHRRLLCCALKADPGLKSCQHEFYQ